MRSLTKKLVEFLKKEDGPTAVEYAVMLALIIVVCIAAITDPRLNANSTFSFVGSSIKPPPAAGQLSRGPPDRSGRPTATRFRPPDRLARSSHPRWFAHPTPYRGDYHAQLDQERWWSS